MATIRIRNLKLNTVIGVNDWERTIRQDVIVNITFDYDATAAAASDRIADAIDYDTLAGSLAAICERSQFQLIEALADALLRDVMRIPAVHRAVVCVDKPGAIRQADSVSVELAAERHP